MKIWVSVCVWGSVSHVLDRVQGGTWEPLKASGISSVFPPKDLVCVVPLRGFHCDLLQFLCGKLGGPPL